MEVGRKGGRERKGSEERRARKKSVLVCVRAEGW